MIKVACDYSDANEPPVVMLGEFDSSFVSLLSESASLQPLDALSGSMADLYVCLTSRILELAEICRRIQNVFRSANFLYIADSQTFKKYKNQIAWILAQNCLLTTSANQLLFKAIADVDGGPQISDQ